MPWLNLYIDTNAQEAPALEDALLAVGAAAVTLEDNADQPILEPALGETPLWDNTRVTGLFDADINTDDCMERLQQALRVDALPPLRWEAIEDKDWEREWMSNYHPIHCGGPLWICPSWLEPPEPEAVNLMLDPGLAFGTGTHPTTHLCLQWLASFGQRIAPWSTQTVVDYGCGSGILGIAALLLGANSAVGVDIDPQALIATKSNTERNGLPAEQFPVFLPNRLEASEPVDLVLANILAGPLAELAPTLADLTKSGGWLCLSGILEIQADVVMAAYAPWFDFEPIAVEGDWVRITGQKR